MRSDVRRFVVASALAVAGVAATRATLIAHAMLLSAEPKSGTVLGRSPERIRLVFSEAIDVSVSGMRLTSSNGAPRDLVVKADPHDVAALIAPLDVLPAGAYRVAWRTVSADGHRVDGSITFTVAEDTARARAMPPPVAVDSATERGTSGPMIFGAPIFAALLRGLSLVCLMAFAGILLFVQRAHGDSGRALGLAKWFGAGAVVLLAAHLCVWIVNSAPSHEMDLAWASTMLGTSSGHIEIARLVAALLAMWALVLARRDLLALMFAGSALVVSGAVGHPAAMHPIVTIPAKAMHLCAGAAWLGGLIWLLVTPRDDMNRFAREARRVSGVALISVGLIVFSGLAQTFNVLIPPSELFHTRYGLIVLLKITGVLILVGFGAYHRYRELPAVTSGDRNRLSGSVRAEMCLLIVVALLGGFVAYVSPHESASSSVAASQPTHTP